MRPCIERLLFAASFLLMSAPAFAASKVQVYSCSVQHFVRDAGTELRSASISVRNPDLSNAATIERITIRSAFGTVVHDSGPAAGAAHPLNTDFASPLDITTVPPGASYYLNTRHVWGVDGLPLTAGGNEAGLSMTATVVVSKAGVKSSVIVSRRAAARTRFLTASGAAEGAERSSNAAECKLD